VLVDPDGTLWVTGRDHIFFLRAGDTQFTETRARVVHDTNLVRAADGTLWVADRLMGVRALPGLSVTRADTEFPEPPREGALIDGARLLFDSQGRLWGTDHTEGGVFMVENPTAVARGSLLHEDQITARFKGDSGLTSEQASPLFEDVEHNIWVGTNFGLDSFRHANVGTLSSITANAGSLFSIAVDPSGRTWVASGNNLYQWVDGELKRKATFAHAIFYLLADSQGGLWFVTAGNLARWRNGLVTPVGLPGGEPNATLTAEATDGAGGLWAGYLLRGIYHFVNDCWTRWDPQLPDIGDATAMASTRNGTVWMGFAGNRILSFDGHVIHHFSASDGLQIGSALSFSAIDSDVLVGGETGLSWNVSGRFQSIASLGDLRLAGVSGIVRGGEWVWLNTSKGVIRVATSELRKALNTPRYSPTFRLFGPHDGLPGIALQAAPTSTAQIDKQGRIWVETNKGIAFIDPSRVRTNQVAPHVLIRYVETDGRRFDPDPQLRLPRLTSRVHIAYTATSLSVPGRVRFRYRLDGVDSQWQEAGNQREAFYTNMKPGTYRFRVVAANEDDVWNDTGTYLDFSIAPAYYQTWWFISLCVVTALVLLMLYLRLRLQRYAVQLRLRLEERHSERDRIARELHDTLLQSIHGLVIRFEAVASQVPRGTPTRRLLDETLERAGEVIVEGRDRVSELRAAGEGLSDLASAIVTVGNQLALVHGFDFNLQRRGSPREIQGLVADECFAIAREALINAAQHSAAREVKVIVEFARSQFALSIEDNGVGMAPSEVATPRDAHFGITGMRERAANIGSTIHIVSARGAGTTITLAVPARRAYARRGWRQEEPTKNS